MTTGNDLATAQAAVLSLLQNPRSSYSPKELAQHLTSEGLSENIGRIAMWYLIDHGRIELRPDSTLSLTIATDS